MEHSAVRGWIASDALTIAVGTAAIVAGWAGIDIPASSKYWTAWVSIIVSLLFTQAALVRHPVWRPRLTTALGLWLLLLPWLLDQAQTAPWLVGSGVLLIAKNWWRQPVIRAG